MTHTEQQRAKYAGPACMLVAGLFVTAVQAEENAWAYCAPSPAATSAATAATTNQTDAMSFTADTVTKEGAEYRLQGKVVGQRGDQRLEAQRLLFNEQTEQAQADGDVRYQLGNRLLTSDTARLHFTDDTGQFSPARFWLTDKHIRGSAETMELKGKSVSELQKAQFTTCDEGDNAWLLKASSLRLDTEENEGIARHARIEFMHVPIFYFPYLSFPLQGRKTGFLMPSFGETSVAGSELTVPWYWNIAPDRDATITPRFMTKRGVLVEGEFRYLNEHSAGQLDVAHLSDDQVYEDDRSTLRFNHVGDPAPGWRTAVDYRYASDEDYLDDFGDSLSTASITHLERRGELNYQSDSWRAGLLVQGYQTLDETLAVTSRPYQRLPQLQLAMSDWLGPAGVQMGFSAEAVKFDRAEGVVGTRLDLQPTISWPLRGAPGFLVPKLTLRHTQYALEKNDPTTDANATRTLPLFSLDSGLVFERELSGYGKAERQTLEPRLYYLYVPKKEQADLIVDESGTSRVFDSSQPLFAFGQLFRENRFNGGDRVGDANQISGALSTRFFDGQGRELFSANLGRIVYFQDREVTLPGAVVETDNASNWVAEMRSQWIPGMSTRASLEWSAKDSKLDRGTLDWRYQKGLRQMVRMAYRFERETLKQVDVAGIWLITARWHAMGRWLRSIRDQTTLETLAGLEYESCCWAARIVQRRHRDDVSEEEFSDSIWLQLELKGLTSVGRKVENLLARDILAP